MNEVWKRIDNYPEYEISTNGNVRSIDRILIDTMGRRYNKKGKLISLKCQTNKDGYKQMMVHIWSNKKEHNLIVSRLVAQTFIPNPNNLPQVNHIDENSLNNNVDNLEWCTCKYNVNYNNLVERRSKNKCRKIDVYDKDLNFLETLSSGIDVSLKYNVSRGMVSMCCNNKISFAKGYCFKFH